MVPEVTESGLGVNSRAGRCIHVAVHTAKIDQCRSIRQFSGVQTREFCIVPQSSAKSNDSLH